MSFREKIINKSFEKLSKANKEDASLKIEKFFKSLDKAPDDSVIHFFADKEGIDTHKFESEIYSLLFKSYKGLNLKHSEDPDKNFDPKELARGVEVEQEHIDNLFIAKAIAKAHLSEIQDYYTRLDKMESEAKK